MNKLFFIFIISAKALSFTKYSRFEFRDVGFNNMNMILDKSHLKDTKECFNAKKYMVRNVENQHVRYISLFNTTSNATQSDPLIFVFIKIVPVIQTMSVEFILLPLREYSSQEIKNLVYITYGRLNHLCEITGLKLDLHYLKYNGNDKWFLEFAMCQT